MQMTSGQVASDTAQSSSNLGKRLVHCNREYWFRSGPGVTARAGALHGMR